ncbi:hypothetical protein [Paenibacillus sp. CAA11]|uniref:hypothetical protein n=1 Tax=Paenibacillus sp. CAA11 TaxID=1532905 RepID=UPI002D77407B|nr:hypothetical protein [Paenibacillus sp. CAA11]
MDEQLRIITDWEEIRGAIPSRVMELEQNIDLKLRMMSEEEDFDITCSLNGEIAELASVINDLHIWYRITAEVSSGHRHL